MTKFLKKGEYEYAEADRLGKGSFGQVYKGRIVQTGQVVAIKIISMKTLAKYGDEIKKVVSSEVSVMVKLSNKMREKNCPYIVRIIDCFRTQSNIYMILEFCGEGDLEKYIMDKGQLPEKEAVHILYEVCMSLEFLCENGVTHRDLKPQNVFMKMQILQGQKQIVYKLGDFGFAAQKKTFSTTLGTYPYMAPELFASNQYDSCVDVWALGVMAHQLVFGEIYFIGNDQWEIKKKVNTKEYKLTPEQMKMVSPEFEDFVTKCLIKNKDQRMRADQLCSHPLFKASRAKELEIPVAVKNAHNNYFVKSIKQLVYKSVFLAEVSKSIAETGRKTLFATMYLAKKSLCFASLLESKLSKALSPFECDKNAWTIFLTSKDFRDATQFVTAVRTNVLTFFNAVYQQFKQYISRFSRQDQQRMLSVVSQNPSQDIHPQIFENEIIKWRRELDGVSGMKILAIELLLASKIDLITTFDFEQHANERKQMTEETLKTRIYQI